MAFTGNDHLEYSKSAAELLTEPFEGDRLTAYRDQGGVLTIGYGHTGPDVTEGMVITKQQEEIFLMHDIQTAANFVKRVVTVSLYQDEFDSLVDFTFNVGVGNFLRSTLLKLVNDGKFGDAVYEFAKWDKVAGKDNPGLLRRRMAEAELFQHGIIQVAA